MKYVMCTDPVKMFKIMGELIFNHENSSYYHLGILWECKVTFPQDTQVIIGTVFMVKY